MREEDKKN